MKGHPEFKRSQQQGFFQFLKSLKLHHILLITLFAFFLLALAIHWALNKVIADQYDTGSHISRYKMDAAILDDPNYLEAADLRSRIQDMWSIKLSVSNELKDLEARRLSLRKQIADNQEDLEKLKTAVNRMRTELSRLQLSNQHFTIRMQAEVQYRETVEKKTAPKLSLPAKIVPQQGPWRLSKPKIGSASDCHLNSCFDFSRCSVSSGFPIHVQSLLTFEDESNVVSGLEANAHYVQDGRSACVYFVLTTGEYSVVDKLESLPFWGGDGRNHAVLFLANVSDSSVASVSRIPIGKAIRIDSTFTKDTYRHGFDLIVPPVTSFGADVVPLLPPAFSPARRKYLISFQGAYNAKESNDAYFSFVTKELTKLQHESASDKFFLQFQCGERLNGGEERPMGPGFDTEWRPCLGEYTRKKILEESTFCLLLGPGNGEFIATHWFYSRLMECLQSGAIPVVTGAGQMAMPMDEVIDWRKIAVNFPLARLPELHFVLKSIPDADLLVMRRQGYYAWESYFRSGEKLADAIVSVLRTRLLIPPPPVEDVASLSVFNSSFTPLKFEVGTSGEDLEEILGPSEPPMKSMKFARNFSQLLVDVDSVWNTWFQPHVNFPSRPTDVEVFSEAKFVGSEAGFRPLGGGAGGAGKEFSESLGGNLPKEQFTIVILTYQREQVLLSALSRFFGLPYLNKVVVIWNDPLQPPPETMKWPEIGVPIEVIRATKNSLNNRFVPYSVIETDAVLSIDDDAYLRHDEIIFGFRVWREARDRIVGFPGRYHAWDVNVADGHTVGGWLYNSNYSCELSMVLTGAAFLHKYYLYQYTHFMPQVIREKVDEFMNCEDIAMNYLVSHLTRKPPIKVTSRWTFRCPGCPLILSQDETHFLERHKCMQFFAEIYGYMPLLYTQFRADSVLFKTRLPRDKQKCFKYI